MEWLGFIALLLLLCYSSYPSKVKKLEAKIKKLEKKQKGDSYMARLISDLVGKKCKIVLENAFVINGTVLDADDEWIKIETCHSDKKEKNITKIIRIEEIHEVELINE